MPKPSASHDLPSLGFPASNVTPSGKSPGTTHRTGGNSSAMSSAAEKILDGPKRSPSGGR